MKILNNICRSWLTITGLISHQLCLLKLPIQGCRIAMLERIQLVIAWRHNMQNDVGKTVIRPNLIQKELKAACNDVNSSRRPDAVMRILHQHNYSEARGFGEIKTAERIDENYELVKDLVRCCIFSKESIDINDMKRNLFFQVVGFKIGFYYFSLTADGIYTAIEICTLEIPSSLETMAMFITQLDDLLLVSTIFEKGCNKHEKPDIYQNMKRETLDSPTFHSYLDKRKSKFNRRTLIF